MSNDNTVLMEGMQIIFRNFIGNEGPFNKPGSRNFGVLVDEDTARKMLADDWNIKYLKLREDEDEDAPRQAWLPVEVKYENLKGEKVRPPRVVMITSRGRTNLTETDIELLDWAEIINVDLIVRPFAWEFAGKSGVKAYLQSMYVTIEEDALERKYSEMDAQ